MIMRNYSIMRVLLVTVFIACICLAFVQNTNQSNDLYNICNCCLIVAGLIAGFLTFSQIYGKDYLVPAFLIIFIKYAGGATVLKTISVTNINLEQSFTGMFNFIVAWTIVACCKELFLLFK